MQEADGGGRKSQIDLINNAAVGGSPSILVQAIDTGYAANQLVMLQSIDSSRDSKEGNWAVPGS